MNTLGQKTCWRAAALLALSPSWARAIPSYVNNQGAALAVGQPNLTFSGVNGTPGVVGTAVSNPGGLWTDGTSLILADTSNHRVLIYNSIPASFNVPADVVVGQPDFNSRTANQGGLPGANTLVSPTGVYSDGTNLFIADSGNNRVLIFNSVPTANNALADEVVGQAGMNTGQANRGAAVGAATLSNPLSVYSGGVGGPLVIADKGNNRALIYNAIPASNGVAANLVVGQASLASGSANQGGAVGAKTLSSPVGVFSDGTRLFIADQGNNRVLIYNAVPAANNVSADVAVGQVFLTSAAANQGGSIKANTLSAPAGVLAVGSRLFIADQNNNRVLIYNSLPAANNASASFVAGQTTFIAGAANQGGSVKANTLSRPVGVFSDGVGLYVSDPGNNRALIYGAIPAGNNASAAMVVGQPDFNSGTANQIATVDSANTLSGPFGVFSDRSRLFIADRLNNRVLIYNAFPAASNASADVAVGQLLMSSGSANQGGSAGANTLFLPAGVYSDGSRMVVSDQINSRVLIYNAIPSANNASANVVVGQTNMTSRFSNQGGSVRANTLSFPGSVASDGTRLFVSDLNNNRVLIYSAIPSTNNVSADFVVGQVSMSSAGANQGGSVQANTLNRPQGVYSDGTRLFIADQQNNRVLIYNPIPSGSNAAAAVVVGQPNKTSGSPNQGGGPRANTLRTPAGVYSDGTRLFIADTGNSRVLVYNTIPAADNVSADIVIGQSTPTFGGANQGGAAGANTLFSPAGVAADSTTGRMFVSDSNNNRILLYLPAVRAPLGPAGGTVTFSPPGEPAQVQLQIPSAAFPQAVNVTLSQLFSFPNPVSRAAALIASGVGVQVSLDQSLQPAGDVTISISYLPADVAGLDRSRLIIARYDDSQAVWVPLVSVSDVANNRVIAQTNHLSLFEIMQADPSASSVSTVKAFPNPLIPSQGNNAMTFSLAPANARIRVYSLTGVLIKDLSADSTGMARWDATNQSGAKVASGVYFVLVQGNGQGRTFKVAVER